MSSNDITKPVDLTSHAEGTGPKRLRQPVYVDFMPPCNSTCPAGENIQAWLSYAQAGDYEAAFQQIMEDNPFPAIMGRVCVKPCESGCNRNHIDTTINIHAVERYIGDLAIEKKWHTTINVKSSGKKVLVIGAGPSGLSAAYHLAKMGHTVKVVDANAAAGGLMYFGIPSYRLPRNVMEAEIQRIVNMGVTFQFNHTITDVLEEKANGNYDAVFLGIGAQLIKKENIEFSNSIPVMDAFSFLKKIHDQEKVFLGKQTIIYGGGKLAMYIARVVKRLGAQPIVLYAGDRKLMPAYDFEADAAIEEGVDIQWLHNISRVEENRFTIEKMMIDKNKIIGTGQHEIIEADALILATGQIADTDFLKNLTGITYKEDGTIAVNAERMTGYEGVFAGGDMLPGEKSVTIAIGQGKKAAKYIHSYLIQQPYQKPAKHATAGYRRLHMWYKTEAPQQEQDKLSPTIAIRSFEEVVGNLTEKEARYEAQRCLSCGNCFECDGCYGACPENAIIKLGPGKRYRFNYDACTGCAVCYEQCPCHAIDMIAEPVKKKEDAQ